MSAPTNVSCQSNVKKGRCSLQKWWRGHFHKQNTWATPTRQHNGLYSASASHFVRLFHQFLCPRSGMCWKGFLKPLAQCPHQRSEVIEAQFHGKWWLGYNRSSPSLTNFSIDEHISLWIVRICLYLRQRLANFFVKGQTINSLGLQATGSLLQLLNSAVAVTEKLP